jgi:membrane protein required for colicin V production
MAVADIVVVGVIVLSGLIAFSLGFVRVLLGLCGWVGAALATVYGFPLVRPFMHAWIESNLFADALTALGVFIVSLVILTAISHAIGRRIRDSGFGALDRSLGLVAGIVMGFVVLSATFFGLEQTGQIPPQRAERPEWVRTARSTALIEWGADTIRSSLPKSWRGAPKTARDRDRGNDSATTLRELVSPRVRQSPPPPDRGYSPRERGEMDRLIQNQQ